MLPAASYLNEQLEVLEERLHRRHCHSILYKDRFAHSIDASIPSKIKPFRIQITPRKRLPVRKLHGG